jgi:hypothetical protein
MPCRRSSASSATSCIDPQVHTDHFQTPGSDAGGFLSAAMPPDAVSSPGLTGRPSTPAPRREVTCRDPTEDPWLLGSPLEAGNDRLGASAPGIVSSPGLTGRSSNPSALSTNRRAAGYWISRLKRGMTKSGSAARSNGMSSPAWTRRISTSPCATSATCRLVPAVRRRESWRRSRSGPSGCHTPRPKSAHRAPRRRNRRPCRAE